MEITLRKAATIAKQLQEAVKTLKLSTVLSHSIYATNENFKHDVFQASSDLKENANKGLGLIEASFHIRKLIGEQNSTAGVNALLAEKAQLDASEKFISSILSHATDGDIFEVAVEKKDVMKLRSKTVVDTPRYGAQQQDIVSVSLMDQSSVDSYKEKLSTIRLQKAKIADEILALNISTKIVLPEQIKTLLKEFKLI